MLPETIIHKLDNPIWYALNETHRELAVCFNGIRFYHPDYCPFGGYIQTEEITKSMETYAAKSGEFFMAGDKPPLSPGLYIIQELVCLQMVIEQKIDTVIQENITPLTPQHFDELYALVNLVQPGYFKTKTALLGDYWGTFFEGRLIAAAGERMQMNELVEVSAIVTHPDLTGRGYAKQLVAHTVNHIFIKGKLPFLHVLESNMAAIRLYEKLGFTTRRKVSLWHIGKI